MSRENTVQISSDLQLDIFETVFLSLLDHILMREKLKSMLESRNRVDEAELDLKLRKLELELINQEKEEE